MGDVNVGPSSFSLNAQSSYPHTSDEPFSQYFNIVFTGLLSKIQSFVPESSKMGTRPPAKAGSWYVGQPDELEEELDEYLANVPEQVDGSSLPIPGARVIIAP